MVFFSGRGGHHPPGPRGHWLAGNLLPYEQDRLGYLQQVCEEYGEIVRFGPRTTIVNEPSIATDLLRNSTEALAVRENFLQQRVTAEQARDTAALRRTMNPGLRREATRPVGEIVARCLAHELETIPTGASAWIDPMLILERTIAGAVAEYYFGPVDAPTVQDQVRDLLDELAGVIGNPFALPQSWGTAVRRRIEARHRDLQTCIGALLIAREAGGLSDLASDILARTGGRYPRPQIATMVVGSLLAAQRVPAAGACWMLMLLADHPEVQQSLAAFRQSGAAEQVVLESLRLYPPTWLITRTSSEPVHIAGYRFAAHHHFMVSPYLLHRQMEQFGNPAQFRPERWTTCARPPVGYLPYGAGVHVCPGRHLATRMLATIALRITADYTIRRIPAAVIPNPRTTLLPENLRISLQDRLSQAEHPAQLSARVRQPLTLADSASF